MLGKSIVCLSCGYKIVGCECPDPGHECPFCLTPMYRDDCSDFRISRPPPSQALVAARLSLQKRAAQRREHLRTRFYDVAFCCALATGVVLVVALLWALAHI